MKNIFSYQDQNAGYNALGFKDENDENVKQFNTKYLNKYNTMKNAQYNRVFNDFNESEEELKNKGEMNCVDIYNKHNVSELVPYYASTKAGLDSVMIHKNLNKMRNGELLTNDEVESTRKYVSDMRELQLRGVTLDGRIEETLFGSIPFLVEAGIGFGTAEYGVGLASLGHTSSKFALRQMARGYAKNEIKKQLKKGANELAKNRTKQIIKDSTIGNLKFSATYTNPEWIRKSGEFMLSDDIAVSERGQYILNMSNSNPAKATMLALGDTMIENLSETSGELFGLAGKAIGKSGTGQAVKRCIDKNVLKKLPSGFAEKFESAVEKSLNMPFVTALHKYGYHGIIEEMGEERVGDFLRVACNIDGEEGYSVEQFLNALFPSADQLATEAIAFGLTGGAIAGGIHVTKKAINKKQYKNFANDIREATKKEDGTYDFEKMRDLISLKNPDLTDEQFENIKKAVTEGIKKGEEYTVDDFLVDSGIIRTPYNNSITDDRIINTLSKYMTNPEDIDTVVNFADSQTKAKLISTFGSQELSEGAEEIKKDFEEKLLQRGVSKQNADLSARLYSALLQTRADRTGRDIEDLYAETNLKIKESDEDEYWQNVAEQYEQFAQTAGAEEGDYEDAIKEWKEKGTDSKYFKKWFGDSKVVNEDGKPLVVYHGSVHNFDTFDKDRASAEGDMGAGFYFTDNESDVDSNYFGGGADFDNKVERLTERIAEDEDIDYEDAKEKAKEQLFSEPAKFEVYLKINNPCYVGKNETYLGSDIFDSVDINEEDYDNYDEYEDARREAEDEALQTVSYDIDDALGDILQYKDVERAKGIFFEYLYDGGVTLQVLKDRLNEEYFDDMNTGDIISNEVARRIVEALGYDGIIDSSVADKFNNMGMEEGTTHYIVFKPEQIKSVNNRGTFDAENPNIYFQSAYHGTPHNFEEFSTNNIGTGEGATAHGWGLYFAENKDISEEYRRKLSDYKRFNSLKSLDEEFDNLLIDNKPILEKYDIDIDRDTYNVIHSMTVIKANRKLVENFLKGKLDEWKDLYNDKDYSFKDYAEEKVKAYNNLLKDISEGATVKDKAEGQLFKVDIPDKDVLLDEQKSFSKQSIKVQKAIKKLPKYIREELNYENEEVTGEDIYGEIVNQINKKSGYKLSQTEAEKRASILLNDLGVKGITYDGREDGRCYVIFDDKAVKVLEKYYQEEEPEQQSVFEGNNKARGVRKIKGSYMPAEKLIEFFKDADESTIVHEFAHWYLDSLIEDAKYHEASADDLAEVRKFVKNNGENFTREQHEKFARGFEAYIRSGRARSNRLKKIFEDFKNALLQIYDTITQIIYTEEGVEKPFTEEDLPQINALFERLLTTETERIRATVFDKVNEIEEQINKIKENEQKEFDELDTIYKDNIEILNRKSDKRRKVQEYIDLAIGSARRETKEIKEWKKRYKNATLDILSAISGKPRNWVANSRNWEKLSELVGNADDKITTSGGLRAEWQDFYADTGVSYDNDEIDGDYKLGEQALQKLIDGDFNPPRADEEYWADVEYFAGLFDYLENKVKKLSGTEKAVAFEALCTVMGKMPDMPEGITKEFYDRLIKIEIDYDKDERELFNRKRYPNIPVVQQLQFYVTKKLNDLRIYNPEMRYKTRLDRSHGLYKSIKNATSVNDTKRIVKKINNFVIEDLRNGQRAILNKEIQKQLKINSKLVKVGSIKRGKFDWRTNTVFAELSQMNKLSREDAQAQYDEVMKINEIEAGEERIDWKTGTDDLSETFDTDFQNNLKRKFLQYKSSRLKNLDVRHTESLLEDILKLKFEGRRAKDEEDFKKRTERLDYRNNLIQILDANKDNKAVKFFANWVVKSGTLTNWETLLNTVFNAETAEKYSLQRLESQVQVFARNKTLELINKANKIYGFNNNKWDKALDYDGMQKFIKLMQDYENETYDYSEVTWNKETREAVKTGLKLSKAQIMTLYIWCQNDDLFQRLNNQYGLEQLKDMFSRLTESDKDMCLEFINVCESMYDDMNEVYINTYGISLPKVENYFPSVTERVGSDLDMFHDFVVKSSNPSFIKTRKVCNKIPMKPKSPLEIILPHINKSANYILMSETVNFYNKIFKETPLNKKIVDIYGKKDGEKIVRAIQNQLSASTFTTVARGLTFAHEFADNLATNFISSSIAGSPKVMFAQLLSCINYSEKMPVHEWAKGFAKAIVNPKKTFEYMLSNCEYLQARLAGNTQNEMMSTLTSEVDRFRTIKNFCSLTTKWGDITAIVFGGKPYVDYLMSQGMSKEDAFNKFVDDTLRAQQAGLNSTTSEWQKAQTKTAMGRAFFAFNNTNLQYERKFIDSLSKFAKGDIDSKDFAKSLIIYKVLNPIMFTSILGNLSLLELVRALTGGDDDPEKAIRKFGGDILLAIMLGSLGAYGIAGLIAISLINYGKAYIDKKIFGEKPFVFKSSVPILDVIDDVGSKALKNEFTLADSIDVICGLGDIGTGLPMSRFENAFGGAENIAQGEYGIGATRMLGWGEYKASEAWTGKSPKERKKNKK